ncbi:SAM-dependent methyltransferase [Actinomadura macra]|uniref:SAM-dependent methyltransferase n=1 Tax=Actinomadura macra TaxID=46164 RepID=UPI000A68AFD1|nr:SAM-dependent methyltransferase [Actinomadura macra]
MTGKAAAFDWAAAQLDLDGFDTARSRMTRLWGLWAGGKEAFCGDREFCDRALEVCPQLTDLARYRLAFRARAVRALVTGCGMDQLLVAGTDLPLHSEVHHIAHRLNPQARVLYADSDLLIARTAEALLTPAPGSVCGYVTAGLDDPAALVEGAARRLNLDRPVGVLVLNSLDVLPDATAAAAMDALRAPLAPGSVLAICHLIDDDYGATLFEALGAGQYPGLAVPRSSATLREFLAGTRLLTPGVVPVSRWRPEAPSPELDTAGLWCGVGQIPVPTATSPTSSLPTYRQPGPILIESRA